MEFILLLFTLKILSYANQQPVSTENEYQVTNVVAVPVEPRSGTARASWYDRSACAGRTYKEDCKTANGDIFDENLLTMACDKSFDLGSRFRLTYNGNSIEVVCNDRGNFSKYGRLFDLSLGAFSSLETPSKGVIEVTYEEIL
jgi:rare lipoprotein A (peptidoglycan hydrolase)